MRLGLRSPSFRHLALLCGVFLSLSATGQNSRPAGSDHPISIRWWKNPKQSPDGSRTVEVRVLGLNPTLLEEWARSSPSSHGIRGQDFLSVSIEGIENQYPIVGEYGVDRPRHALVFKPSFPIAAGLRLKAVFEPEKWTGHDSLKGKNSVTSYFKLPAHRLIPTTSVVKVEPNIDVVPANLLKFYIHFSEPMSRGDSYAHLELINEQGKPVELPFLELQEELWNRDQTRLTVIIDPGRIKRGLLPLEESGPALEQGKSYTLLVRASWKNARGLPLKRNFTKTFQVSAPDRSPLNPQAWRLLPPPTHSRGDLKLDFGEPIDSAVAIHAIHVVDAQGAHLGGSAHLEQGGRIWVFTPFRNRSFAWKSAPYRVGVSKLLEDLAGNNVGRTFDVDGFEEGSRSPFVSEYHWIDWRPR